MKPIVCCERERPDGGAAWEAIGAAFARAPAPVPIEPPARPERRRLWQLPEKHLCVLLGAAFDARELRQLFRRAGYEDWRAATDYALHSTAVHHAKTHGDLSRLMQKKLEERCRAALTRFRTVDSRVELIRQWRSWAATGEQVAAYWAALTHPRCDMEADELLYQEMHMLAHFAFAERRAATRRLGDADERSARLEAALARAQAQCVALRASAASLRSERDGARRELVHASAALARWTQGDEARAWEESFRMLEAERDAARRQAADANRELAALRRRTGRDERWPPPAARPDVVSAAAPVERRCAAPADLTAKRLLCVGGKTRLVPQYRAAVESANGVFLYHDGGVEDHLSRLPAMLRSADAVVCLAGDVSHCAYYAVKRYCKRFGKTCALLANSSVSALSHGLQQVA
jgi:hypothetical protein